MKRIFDNKESKSCFSRFRFFAKYSQDDAEKYTNVPTVELTQSSPHNDEESDDADDDEELDDRESALADANWMSRGFNHCGLSLSAGKPALNASRQSLPSRP